MAQTAHKGTVTSGGRGLEPKRPTHHTTYDPAALHNLSNLFRRETAYVPALGARLREGLRRIAGPQLRSVDLRQYESPGIVALQDRDRDLGAGRDCRRGVNAARRDDRSGGRRGDAIGVSLRQRDAAAFVLPPGAFRLFLAFCVVAMHYNFILAGGYAVFTFFFLSGYWIRRLWDEKYSKMLNPVSTFYCSRAMRIFPLLVTVTIIAASLNILQSKPVSMQGFMNAIFPMFASNPLASNYLVPPSWSLGVELEFYFLFPLLLIPLGSRFGTYLLLAISICMAMYYFGDTSWLHLPVFLIYFVLGTVSVNWSPPRALVALSFVLTIMGLFALRLFPQFYWNLTLGVTLAGLPYARATLRKEAAGSIDRALGSLSYIVYLLHWPIMVALTSLGDLRAVIGPLLTLPASWALYVFVDQPAEKWRQAFLKKRRGARPLGASQPGFSLVSSLADHISLAEDVGGVSGAKAPTVSALGQKLT
jgi:peptidoglycan/LPS O-acetylase OafA/YrhL